MFLPRTSSSASLASLSSIRTTDSRRAPILPGSSIGGWSNPTTASSSINASAHVHYSLLASQYRQQSANKGLGITAGGWEAKRELERLAQQASSSSSSSSKQALAVPVRRAGRRSRRGYAEERLKASEALDDLIFSATDTGRLKWEAKSALLSASPDLALKLLTRAASLGSVSACISLSALYTTGVARGGQPVVVLVHREPQAGLAWILEGCRLLKRRREKNRGQRRAAGDNEALDQVVKILALLERLLRTKQAFAVAGESGSEEQQDGEQGSDDSGIILPDIQQLQARVRGRAPASQSGRSDAKKTEVAATMAAALSLQARTQLWPSVLEARLWLEAELDLLSPSSSIATLDPQASPRGPDDETEESLPIMLARSHLSLIKALASSHTVCQNNVADKGSIESLKRAWTGYRNTLRPAKARKEALPLVEAADQFLADLPKLRDGTESGGDDSDDVRSAGSNLWARLEAALPEAAIPTLDMRAKQPSAATSSTSTPVVTPKKSRTSAATSGQATPTPTRKDAARRRSLEELAPLDTEDAAKTQPALLRPSSPTRSRKGASAELVDTNVQGMAPRRLPSVSSRDVLHRAISHSGATTTSSHLLSAAPTMRRTSYKTPSSGDTLPPSYSHHFGGKTITGAALTSSAAKRPSSVVSDSPSLLFGDETGESGSAQMDRSASYQTGFPTAANLETEDARLRTARPTPPNGAPLRRRVTSLYGQPSSNTSSVHGLGSTATAYGHANATGIFDPTASLRESQYQRQRRRRADSTASVATGASIFSTQPIQDADEKGFYAPQEGHVPGDILVLGLNGGEDAQEKLRGQLGGAPQKKPGMRRTPSGFSIASLRSSSANVVHTNASSATADGQRDGSAAPMLTERLERKLAESYASQRLTQRPGLAALRGDSAQSIRSRFSSNTGLGSLRGAPSLLSFGGAGKGRAPTLGFSTTGSKSATLSTTVEMVEPETGARGSSSASSTKRREQGSRTSTSAVGTLRALNVGTSAGPSETLTAKGKKASSPSARPTLAGIFGPLGPATASAAQISPAAPTASTSASSPQESASNANATLRPVRSFNLIDPTSSAYASSSPSPSGSQPPTPGRPPSALKNSASNGGSASSSPTKRSPPGSVRSVRFAELPPSTSGSSSPRSQQSGLDAALASAEDRSRLKTAAGCSNCGTRCINAPVDRKGRKFCSRGCRIEVKEKDKETGSTASDSLSVPSASGAPATPNSSVAAAAKGRASPVPLSPRVDNSPRASSSSPPSPTTPESKATAQEPQRPTQRAVSATGA